MLFSTCLTHLFSSSSEIQNLHRSNLPPIQQQKSHPRSSPAKMASSYAYQPTPPQQQQNNLNFYQSSYSNQAVSGHTTPFQAAYGGGAQSSAYPQPGYGSSSANYGFGGFAGQGVFPGQPGATGQMGTGSTGLRTGWLAAFGTEGYEGEPSLLEELGVNFGHIWLKTLTVLNPMARIDNHIMDDSDLAGPVLFCGLFGTFLLLVSISCCTALVANAPTPATLEHLLIAMCV